MKYIFILLSLLFSFKAFSKNDIQFNQDVFHCGSEYKTIFELERSAGVYSADALGFEVIGSSYDEALNLLKSEVSAISNSRANLLAMVTSKNNNRVKFKKGIQLVRTSPASNIILPTNCTVEPMSNILVNETGYQVTINEDIFNLLSTSGKIYFTFNLSLDLEQALFNYSDSLDINLNLIQGREFLSCWFSLICRPKTVAEFHLLAFNKIYNLKYLEQDGILIPFIHVGGFPNTIKFNKSTGLIFSAENVLDSNYLFKTSRDFDSYFIFRHKKQHYIKSTESNDVVFNSSGKVMCVPLLEELISFPALNNGEKLKLKEVCWYDSGVIQNASAVLAPGQGLILKVNNDLINVFEYFRFYFYPNGNVNWVPVNASTLHFNNQTLSLDGSLKLFPSGKPQCFQLNKDTNLKLPDGKILRMTINNRFNLTDIYCFKEDGSFDKTSTISYYEAAQSNFPNNVPVK